MPAPAPALNYYTTPLPQLEVFLPDLQLKNLYTSNTTPHTSTGNLTNYGTGGTGALTLVQTDGPGYYGNAASGGFARMTWTAMPTAGFVGFYRNQTSGPALGTPGATYTHSVWVRPSIDYTADRIYIEWFNGSTSVSLTPYNTANLVANTWQRVSVTATMPAGADRGRMVVYGSNAGSSWGAAAIGATLDFSSWLAEQSFDLHDYYFGNSGYSRSNLIGNPSFEVDTSGWSTVSSTVARSTAQAYSGAASALLTTQATANPGITTAARIPVTAAYDYTFSAYVKDVNTSGLWRVAGIFYNALTGGSAVGVQANSAAVTPTTTGWSRIGTVMNVPTGATHVQLYIQMVAASPTAGLTAYIDGILFEQKSGFSTYYTGNVGTNATPDTITIYRLVDGETSIVRNAKSVASSTAFVINDFEAPFGKAVSYWATTSSGGVSLGTGEKATITVDPNQVWISDPLDLSNSMAINLSGDADSVLAAGSFAEIRKGYDYNRSSVLGKARPVLQFYGEKGIEGLQFEVITKSAGSDELKDLLSTSPILLRAPGELGNLPRLLYGVLEASQEPIDWHLASQSTPLTRWKVTLHETEPQSLDIVVTFYSYAYWQAKYASYDAANAVYSASTYINAVRNPPA